MLCVQEAVVCLYLCVVLVKQETPRRVKRFDRELVGTQEERSFNQIYRRHRGTIFSQNSPVHISSGLEETPADQN